MSEQGSEDGVQLDLSDVDHRVGKPVGSAQQWAACSPTDIRRWVQALDYPNPIHWNEEFARDSRFGGVVAPQSFTVALDYGHGVGAANVGHIPGSHLIFGGEEWWFYGTPVRPGDRLSQSRRFHDYKVVDTKFAGPTMFSRGDSIHRNQHGALVAKERATAIRYLAAEAEKRGMYENQLGDVKRWTDEELAEIDDIRLDWILSNREGVSPRFGDVNIGDTLPRRVIGPHNIVTFTTEYRAFLFNAWGSSHWVDVEGDDPWNSYRNSGWIEGFGLDHEAAKIDPRHLDGVLTGPSRGHVDPDKAGEVGMARAYGYGATMGAWNTDYLAYWAGHDGMVRHSKARFEGPAFEGDVTFVEGEVIDKETDSAWGVPLVTIRVEMTNQGGDRLVTATAEVELPLW